MDWTDNIYWLINRLQKFNIFLIITAIVLSSRYLNEAANLDTTKGCLWQALK